MAVYNCRQMTFLASHSLTLLLAGAVPPSTLLPDLLQQLQLPALAQLLARAEACAINPAVAASGPHTPDPYTPYPAQQQWLAQQAGFPQPHSAPYMMLADGGTPAAYAWYCLQPVHLHATRDHLVLTDPTLLDIEPEEAAALHEAARPVLAELAAHHYAGAPTRWYVSAERLGPLHTAAPQRACGRNIDIWMPRDTDMPGCARQWRKWQNEIQMIWFDHPVNQQREARGQATINSLWLYGYGQAASLQLPFRQVQANDAYARGLALQADVAATQLQAGLPPTAGTLRILDTPLGAAMQDDWGSWIDIMHALEQAHFAPALAALQHGHLKAIELVLCSELHWQTVVAQRSDFWKFWRRRTLSTVLGELSARDDAAFSGDMPV